MSLLLATVPIGVAAAVLLVLRRGTLPASMLTLLAAVSIALAAPPFALAAEQIGAAAARGAATSLVVLYVLFPSLLLYHIQRGAGGLEALAGGLARITQDRDIQVLLLVLGLSPFIESVTGFGVAAVVVVPLLIALGVGLLPAAVLGVLGQMTVPWGALAVGTTLGAKLSHMDPGLLGERTALLTAPLPVVYALAALAVSGGRGALRRSWVPAVVGGTLLFASAYAFSQAPGIELAGVLAGALTAGVLALWGRARARDAVPASSPLTPCPPSLAMPLWRAALPYAALTGLLLASRLVTPLREWLQQTAVLRVPELGLALPLLYSPGFWVLVAAGVAALSLRAGPAGARAAAGRAWRQFLPGAAAVAGFLAAAQVMVASGMVLSLADAAADLGVGYVWLAPWLGALGGWLTGSNVGSNAMFAPLQQAAGLNAGLPVEWLMGAQNGAGSHATMISPTRVTIAAAAAGLAGGEGRILRASAPVVLAGLIVITVLLAAAV